MPYPNEHAARINSPDKYKEFNRKNNEFGDGIDVIYGITEDGTAEIQAIRFRTDKFTAEEAKQWLSDNGYEPISFEEATEESKAEINIISDIGQTDAFMAMFGFESFGLSNINDFIAENSGANHLQVNIHSCGGLLDEAYAIHDKLKTTNKHRTTCIMGECYSAATVIALAGTDRQIYENASIIIHEPMRAYCEYLNASELSTEKEALQAETDKLINFYSSYLKIDKEKIKELMDKEEKINSEKALEYGFVTEIIKTNGFINKNFKNMTTLNKELTDKLGLWDKIIEKLKNYFPEKPVNMMLKDVNGNELTLTKEAGEPQVGDDASPDGEFLMETGETIVVSGGKITEIKPKYDEMEDMKQQLEDLKTENNTLKEQLQAKADKEAELQAFVDEMQPIAADLRKIHSNYNPEGRQTHFTDPPTGKSVDEIKAELDQARKARRKK